MPPFLNPQQSGGVTTPVSIANGGTGATTAAAARSSLGVAATAHNQAATTITSGTLSDARLSANVTVQGNTFNNSAKLIQASWLPTVPPAGTITLSGVPDLGGTVSIGGGTWTWVETRTMAMEVAVGADPLACAANLAAALVADYGGITATDNLNGTITVSVALDTPWDGLAFSETSTNLTMDGNGFLGGSVTGQWPLLPPLDGKYLVNSFLTAGSVPIATHDGALTSDAGLSFDATTDTLSADHYLGGVTVTPSTALVGAPNVITAAQSGSVFTNEGTTGLNYHTLPTAAARLTYTFLITDADGMHITANTDDTIRLGADVTPAAGFIESTTPGDFIILTAVNDTEWFATSSRGTWIPPA